MITYYIIGSWMGSFRTVSTTETREQFKEYCDKWGWILNENGIYIQKDGSKGRIVIESGAENNEKLGI